LAAMQESLVLMSTVVVSTTCVEYNGNAVSRLRRQGRRRRPVSAAVDAGPIVRRYKCCRGPRCL